MSHLCQYISDRIRSHPQGKISFAEYMDLALYHPQYGYYASHIALIGAKGDFVTAPHLTSDFGELLGIQFEQMWTLLGRPTPFTLIEMGAGQGVLIRDVCHYLHRHHPQCFEALEYVVVEKSAALIQAQRHHVGNSVLPGQGLRWCSWDEIENESVVGCFFSNELVDAFPVHLICWNQGKLQERYVTLADAEASKRPFQDVVGELSTTALKDYFDLVAIDWEKGHYESGYCSEVNLATLDWMTTVASKLQRGYVLTIDYGYPATRYYNPTRREGTLQCYYQHAHHSDPYIHVGQQDITAHVDFTALQRQGEQNGLYTEGFTQQGLFLMALGLGDRLAALSTLSPSPTLSVNDILRRREALHALINPMGMGNFGVLVQSKGINSTSEETRLNGFKVPPMG